MDVDRALVELQTRLAFQEESIDQLSRTLAAQHDQIEQLIVEVARLQAMVRELRPSPIDEVSGEPPPPHY
jgi:SlyX protein